MGPPERGHDWLWPYWLERQSDPTSAAFVAGGGTSFPANLTGRNWTTVGNPGSPRRPIVDPRGLVTPRPRGWSLDWWVGAEDRWHLPAREVAVRQRLLGAAPVVETAMRVPSGDVVQRVFAVQATGAAHQGELLVVELENRSPLPVAVAVAVRPYNPEGLARVLTVALDDRVVIVDGRPGVLLPRPPMRVAASTLAAGDCAAVVTAGQAGTAGDLADGVRCRSGMAQAAFVFPLPHTATLRVGLPLTPEHRARRRARGRGETRLRPPTSLAPADAVVRGWAAQSRKGMRLELPDPRLAEAVDANRRFLLLGGKEPGGFDPRVVSALDRYGLHAEAAETLVAGDHGGRWLWALAEHRRLCGERVPIDTRAVMSAVNVVRGLRRPAAGGGGGHAGHLYRDDLWAAAGLGAGAEMLEATGEANRAAGVREEAASMGTALGPPLDAVAGLGPSIDETAVDSLLACRPLGLVSAHDPRMTAIAQVVRDRFCHGRAVLRPRLLGGLSPSATLGLASVELAAGDPRALERLWWLLEAATSTFSWPGSIHPHMGSGCGGEGHDREVTAAFLTFVRSMLVSETSGGLTLFPVFAEGWRGQAVEVHDAPTHFGRMSFALRWHGDRPALLWELKPHRPADGVRLTAPGLDPSWTSTETAGEALLAPAGGGQEMVRR